MLKESGRVVAIDEDGLWVETLKTSTCAKCVAKSGCGQNLAAKLIPSHNMTLIKAYFAKQTDSNVKGGEVDKESQRWNVGDTAIIGVAENALLSAALFAYGMPLVLMIIGVLISQILPPLISSSDLQAALGAVLGLFAGGSLVKLWSNKQRNDGFFQAHVVSRAIATDTMSADTAETTKL